MTYCYFLLNFSFYVRKRHVSFYVFLNVFIFKTILLIVECKYIHKRRTTHVATHMCMVRFINILISRVCAYLYICLCVCICVCVHRDACTRSIACCSLVTITLTANSANKKMYQLLHSYLCQRGIFLA